MDTEKPMNPLEWAQHHKVNPVKIPGGLIRVEEWKQLKKRNGEIVGDITFRFYLSPDLPENSIHPDER